MDSSRIFLIGQGPTALTALQSLVERFRVIAIVRQRASQSVSADPVEEEARRSGVPVYPHTSPARVANLVEELQPDCVVVSSYDRVLPGDLLARSRFVNVHYSALPAYRGRANVNWAIINGEPHTAITIHRIEPGLDAGRILYQTIVPIGPRDTVGALYDRLNQLQRLHLAETLSRHLDGFQGVSQNEGEASYGCTRTPDDGLIDWTAGTANIDRLIRALSDPFPGAFGVHEGRRLIIWRAVPLESAPRYAGRIPGRVVGISRQEGYVDVLTGDGAIRVLEVQQEDGVRRRAADVIRSVKVSLSLSPLALLDRIRQLETRLGEAKK